jgi:hypothetical protein
VYKLKNEKIKLMFEKDMRISYFFKKVNYTYKLYA